MNETYNFLKERTKVNFVSTINGERPSCRPFGDSLYMADVNANIYNEDGEILYTENF